MPFRPVSPVIHRIVVAAALLTVPSSLLSVHFLIADEFGEVRDYVATAERTVETRDQLAQLLALHLDVETGIRGYVLTGDPDFLGPYLGALPHRDARFAQLREGADEQRLAELNRLLALSDAKLENAAINMRDVRGGLAERARERIATGRGRHIMDLIRASIARMDAEEATRLSSLTRAGTASRQGVEHAITLLLAGVAILLAFVTLLVSESMRHRRLALVRVEQLAKRQMAMFDGAVDGMLWLDAEGRILRINRSISRMFGYGPGELFGQHNTILMEHDYTLVEAQAFLATVGVADADGAGRRQEFLGRRADGETFETEVAISRVEGAGEDRHAPRFIASIRDISHRKRAERMKTEFVSTVSHELRTPLTSIGGSLGLVMGGAAGPLEEKTRRLIGIAHANCERLVRLINDILDIDKIESGKMEFDMRRMHVAPLVRRTQEAMTSFAEQHGVILKVVLPPWPQCITGDPDRLEQLLTNLVSNAIKHSPAGETVLIACTQQGGNARIEVADRGMGVPADFRSRIFTKFAMADASDSRAKGGTGLGLSIAQEIARLHGAAIAFADREGGGTVFHFDIPLMKQQALPGSRPADRRLPLILHLDDDPDTLSVVASAFAGKARVMPASTVAEARAALAKQKPVAAIIDISLVAEDGLELAAALRQEHPGLPLVLFTAVEDNRDTSMADRLLVKSRASVENLVDATMALIARRARRAA